MTTYKSPEWYSSKLASAKKRITLPDRIKQTTDTFMDNPYGHMAATTGIGALIGYLMSDESNRRKATLLGGSLGLLAGPSLRQKPIQEWRVAKERTNNPDYQAEMDDLQYDKKHGIQSLKALRDIAKQYPQVFKDTTGESLDKYIVRPSKWVYNAPGRAYRYTRDKAVEATRRQDERIARYIRGDK